MILVAGSANLDFVVSAHHIPAPGETVLGREFKTFPGGKGANQAIACARAGAAPTAMLLALGVDAFATPLENSLKAAGVQLHIKRDQKNATGTAFICVSDDAENAITVAPGANNSLTPADWISLPGISHLVMQLETPLATVAAYAQTARAQGVVVVLNAAPAQVLPADLLAHIDILIVNEGELAVVANHQGSVAQCLEQVKVPCVVVTLGSQGSCARLNGALLQQAAFKIKPVDTTAAGDSFVGCFVAALSHGKTMQQALREGNAAGALACLTAGAQASIPTQTQVQQFLAEHTEASNPT
jgi:ribokinase